MAPCQTLCQCGLLLHGIYWAYLQHPKDHRFHHDNPAQFQIHQTPQLACPPYYEHQFGSSGTKFHVSRTKFMSERQIEIGQLTWNLVPLTQIDAQYGRWNAMDSELSCYHDVESWSLGCCR